MTIDNSGRKDDTNKLPWDLLPADCLEEVVHVLQHGAKKYAPYNWSRGMLYSRLFAACLRHIWSFWRGERNDLETERHHLAHAICCLLFLLYYELHRQLYEKVDDRVLYFSGVKERREDQKEKETQE